MSGKQKSRNTRQKTNLKSEKWGIWTRGVRFRTQKVEFWVPDLCSGYPLRSEGTRTLIGLGQSGAKVVDTGIKVVIV